MFYIWKKAGMRGGAVPYLLVPVYLVMWWGMLRRLRGPDGCHSWLWIAGLVLCTSLVLVPAHLVEFRYFTVPAMMWQVHMLSGTGVSKWTLQSILVVYLAVNAATLWVFLHKPFEAPDGSVGRFMW